MRTQGLWHSWNHVANKRTKRIEWVVSTEEGKCVATLPARTGDSWDAALIAAAPEMLEALKAIESCLAPDDNDLAARKVRAAIAKAEGAA